MIYSYMINETQIIIWINFINKSNKYIREFKILFPISSDMSLQKALKDKIKYSLNTDI